MPALCGNNTVIQEEMAARTLGGGQVPSEQGDAWAVMSQVNTQQSITPPAWPSKGENPPYLQDWLSLSGLFTLQIHLRLVC